MESLQNAPPNHPAPSHCESLYRDPTNNTYHCRVCQVEGPRCINETWLNGYARQWGSQPPIQVVSPDPSIHPKGCSTDELGVVEKRAHGLRKGISTVPKPGEALMPVSKKVIPGSGLLSLYYPTVSPDEPTQDATRISFGGPAHIQTKDLTTGSIRKMLVPVITLPGEVAYACRWCFQLRSAWRLEGTCSIGSAGTHVDVAIDELRVYANHGRA